MMRISAIVRADCGGLGTLSRMFSDYLGFHRTLSIARHNGERYPHWFPNNRHVDANVGISHDDAKWLCEDADVVLTFETWYGERVPWVARATGAKTALVAMYECTGMNHASYPLTDLVICPHELCLTEMRTTPGLERAAKVLLPVPVDTQRIKFRLRERADTFVHIAGRSGAYDRNNTAAVIEAFENHIISDAKLIVRHQAKLPLAPFSLNITCDNSRHEDYWQGWDAGDVLLHPHRWDGCSLPMYEALAAGMPAMTTRFWPFCDSEHGRGWLPERCQALSIDVTQRREIMIARRFTSHETTPEAIAAAVDRIAGRQIASASVEANLFAQENSWAVRGSQWRSVLERLAAGEIDEWRYWTPTMDTTSRHGP